MAVTETAERELSGESMFERLEALVEENGEVMIRLDSGEEAELHKHNVEFAAPPMVKVTTADAIHWFNADKVEAAWIHFDF